MKHTLLEAERAVSNLSMPRLMIIGFKRSTSSKLGICNTWIFVILPSSLGHCSPSWEGWGPPFKYSRFFLLPARASIIVFPFIFTQCFVYLIWAKYVHVVSVLLYTQQIIPSPFYQVDTAAWIGDRRRHPSRAIVPAPLLLGAAAQWAPRAAVGRGLKNGMSFGKDQNASADKWGKPFSVWIRLFIAISPIAAFGVLLFVVCATKYSGPAKRYLQDKHETEFKTNKRTFSHGIFTESSPEKLGAPAQCSHHEAVCSCAGRNFRGVNNEICLHHNCNMLGLKSLLCAVANTHIQIPSPRLRRTASWLRWGHKTIASRKAVFPSRYSPSWKR